MRIKFTLLHGLFVLVLNCVFIIQGLNLVLCFESDGQAVIEDGSCCSYLSQEESSSPNIPPSNNSCNDCEDIPISVPASAGYNIAPSSRNSSMAGINQAKLFAPLFSRGGEPFGSELRAELRSRTAFFVNPSLVTIRTVVLLI
ncbi:MAG: hypothetical protein AAB019_02925 [Planctomycetota bacterium]